MAQRAQRRARQLEAARRVAVPASADVCVVGGGAAGIVAGIVAAERGAHVVVLERDPECGRTILTTGNGRCNFANTLLDTTLYNEPDFVRAVVGPSWLDDVLDFFRGCGLAWEEEAEGRLYPLSRQAASVRNVLLARAQRAGATLAGARETLGVRRTHDAFEVRYEETFGKRAKRTMRAGAVILASGGGTTPCEGLGLPTDPFEPILCPLACNGPLLTELDGRRVHVEAHLVRHGNEALRERGEVLFRSYGLSGIVVFDLSRHARPGDRLLLDLLPGLSHDEAQRLATNTLDGLLDPVIAQALVDREGSIKAALARAKALPYVVTGPTETGRAQVTRGGLAIDAFNPATLEARATPGVFACGEVLDVDGPCGGFNLAWAWKSGMVVGTAAAAMALRQHG